MGWCSGVHTELFNRKAGHVAQHRDRQHLPRRLPQERPRADPVLLTDDIRWTVFGGFQATGKEAYDQNIDGAPVFIDPPELEVVRMVEQGDVVMAELVGVAKRAAGGEMRMSMAEVFVMREGKIAERRAWVVELKENDFR
ncbi:nuclear transport factor 2 family protein [Saccharopolyspora kobensis]|uniref:nuclear transport factor 2 family protein n=1 Tax=Saccharopolyspora kobensis TaxID=146035 RepID=UPI000AFFC873|nr:nuclear transport factor 2 family protein [Saccharopolyspora kobensis]